MAIPPYGGTLVERVVTDDELADGVRSTAHPGISLTNDDLITLGNLAHGHYSPLAGFMTQSEYEGVIENARLPSGLAWTIPVLLHVAEADRDALKGQSRLALHDGRGRAVATVEVTEVFEIDPERHCAGTFGTTSPDHPGVQDLMKRPRFCIGGPIHVGATAFPALRHQHRPAQNRQLLEDTGKATFTAFSTRNICHLGHDYLHRLALEKTDVLGINVITGAQVKGNFLSDVVFDTYEYLILSRYPTGRVLLNNLRLPPIYAGPREAFLQAIVLQNLGFTQFIVGRDHAGIGSYYPKYGSQEIFSQLSGLEIEIMAIPEPRYCNVCREVTTEISCPHGGADVRLLNGRDVRRFLLEKRYNELESILGGEVQDILIRMFEERTSPATDEVEMVKSRPLLYD